MFQLLTALRAEELRPSRLVLASLELFLYKYCACYSDLVTYITCAAKRLHIRVGSVHIRPVLLAFLFVLVACSASVQAL